MSDQVPTLRAYGEYLQSLERPLDFDALVAEGSARRNDDATRDPDALEPVGADAIVADLESSRGERTGHRRWLLAAAAVVAAALVVGGTVLVTGTGGHRVRTKPAGQTPTPTPPETVPDGPPYRRLDGTFGVAPPVTVPGDGSSTGPLVPEGEPSGAPTGELVAAIHLRHRTPLTYRLYADGRLLRGGCGMEPGCLNTPSGWVEQRLTPEGVERVRSRFLSSGLFDSAQPLSDVSCTFVHACVRDGDHWLDVQVDVGGPAASQAPPEAVRLFDDLKMLDSTLPATEWADQQIKPYVPARTAVCLQVFVAKDGTAVQVPTDLSILLPSFPARAAELFYGRDAMGRIPSIEEYGGSCFEMTLDEARTLADEFLAPSGGGSHEYWGIVVEINDQFDVSQPPANSSRQRAVTREGTLAHISFKPLLPDSVNAELGD